MLDKVREDNGAKRTKKPSQKLKLIPVSPVTSDEEVEPPPKSPRVERYSVSRWSTTSTEELERELTEMERYLQVFPFRKLGDLSREVQGDIICAFCEAEGQHYSDSCAQVISGDQRLEIISIKGWYNYCLEDCPVNRQCKFAKRHCWYCRQLEGTVFVELIPRDGVHHRALCNVPNAKSEARSWILEAREELKMRRSGRK
ncbi:hypothetical protein RB195_012956 [Necator americanus]|uniref:Uncharacterized protein n=1 Tax=Necator americanus TaxID=51031 RepID=A0ABR1DTA5_NECAM